MVGGAGRFHRGGGRPDDEPELDAAWRSEVRQKLLEFRASDGTEISFPHGERHERRFVHTQAAMLGLVSRSQGRGIYRHCIISRRKPKNLITAVHSSDAEPIKLTPNQKALISSYITNYPIYDDDIDDHLHVAKEGRINTQKKGAPTGSPPLVPPFVKPSPDIARLRSELPAAAFRDQLIEAINSHKVTLITGGTGCGKTTQVPQFLLEWAASSSQPLRVVCTQPRRLPAIAVAERVARERNERLGSTVGYHIRLEQRVSSQTVLTYCTSGILLRMLTQDELASDCTHIILDEIHEREQNTDYLLIALKQALAKREDLKVILMSATMEGNLEMFLRYFDRHSIQHVDIPSRLYHVEKFYLSDVIALAGYAPPPSPYGGGIFSSFQDFNPSSSFPMVDSWEAGGSGGNSHDPFASAGPWVNPLNQSNGARNSGVPTTGNGGAGSAGGGMVHSQSVSNVKGDQFMNLARQLRNARQAPPAQPPPHSSTSFHRASSSHSLERPVQQPEHDPAHSYYPEGGQPWVTEIGLPPGGADVVDLPCNEEDDNALMRMHDMTAYQVPPPSQPATADFSAPFASQPFGSRVPFQPGQAQQPSFFVPEYGMSSLQPSSSSSSHIQPPSPAQTPAFNHNSFIHRSTSFGGGSFSSDADVFGRRVREQDLMQERVRNGLRTLLPLRPPTFNEVAIQQLRDAQLDHDRVVNCYLNCGGRQWEDSVDVDLVFNTIAYLMDSSIIGSILVFLPGYEDIQAVAEKVGQARWNRLKPQLCMLHSQLNTSDQQRVFAPTPPGLRKVILSTNIAEASLTIDDVVFVIDCGKAKEKTYEHSSRISQLKVVWVAKSNAEQRSGRAGRCRPGFCFRLYSRTDYERMLTTQVAEMRRSAIHEVCLHAKMFAPEKMSVKEFLEMAPEPPLSEAVDSSLNFLEQLGALYSDEPRNANENDFLSYPPPKKKEPELTELGRLIALLPLEPQLARLLLFGFAFRCFNPVVTLVALLSHRDPFTLAVGEEKTNALSARDSFAMRDFSDHLMLLRAFNAYCKEQLTSRQISFCRTNFLSYNTMKMVDGIRKQLLTELRRLHFISDVDGSLYDPILNEFSCKWPMVQAAIVAGCHPCIGFVKSGSKLRKIRTWTEGTAQLHPSTSLRRQLLPPERRSAAMRRQFDGEIDDPSIEFLVFQEHVRIDEGLTLRTVSAVPPATVILFAGPIRLPKDTMNAFSIAGDEKALDEDPPEEESFFTPRGDILELESWFCVRGNFADLTRLLQLRFKLMEYFLAVILDPHKINEPQHRELLVVLSEVLEAEHKKQGYLPVKDVFPRRYNENELRGDYIFRIPGAQPSSSAAKAVFQSAPEAEKSEKVERPEEKEAGRAKPESNDVRLSTFSGRGFSSQPATKQYPDPYRSEKFLQEKEEEKIRNHDNHHHRDSTRHVPDHFRRESEMERQRKKEERNGNGEMTKNSHHLFGSNYGLGNPRPTGSQGFGFGERKEKREKVGDRFYRAGNRKEREDRKQREREKEREPEKETARQGGFGRVNRRLRDDEDEQVPEDPITRNGGGSGGFGRGRPISHRYSSRHQNNHRVERQENDEAKKTAAEEEEDWGATATFPSFVNKEVIKNSNLKNNKPFRTFVRGGGRRGFGPKVFGTLRSDRLSKDEGEVSGKSREAADNGSDWSN